MERLSMGGWALIKDGWSMQRRLNSDSSPVERKKQAKKGKKAKVDAVSMVSHIGKAWIGDIKDVSLDVMKHMV
ncbi:hypothetical protein PAXRUDRAFT_19749 [Paxillus rubicundulus Ve08.2h10]|uniref:Uncharacterized protein n=1 Tax=Paxillus rubicundulus Ve08.2h10 TaxID=930991 RepID=A0A0D0DBD8_9AGAM|nr:hypothetical protein PAXRUDRAFT_19749 [Paxillus rubicundulus Ve08.2h10]